VTGARSGDVGFIPTVVSLVTVPRLGDEAALFGRTSLSVVVGADVVVVAMRNYTLDAPPVLRSLAEIAVERV
jgi:hypothetical protein